MSNLPIKQLKINGQKFIPNSDTLVADSNNEVYKKNKNNELVALASKNDIDLKLDKNNGVATGKLKIKATDIEVPGLMITTSGDNEDRWFAKFTQDQIEVRQAYNQPSEIYEFFDNTDGNKIARYKDVILSNADNINKNISLVNDGNGQDELKIELKNDPNISVYSDQTTTIKQASIQLSSSGSTNLDYTSNSLLLTSNSLELSNLHGMYGAESPYSEIKILLNSEGIQKSVVSGINGGEETQTSYTYSLPDKTGTIALKEDISDLAASLTKLDENGNYQIKDLVKIINQLLDLLGAQEHTIDL